MAGRAGLASQLAKELPTSQGLGVCYSPGTQQTNEREERKRRCDGVDWTGERGGASTLGSHAKRTDRQDNIGSGAAAAMRESKVVSWSGF